MTQTFSSDSSKIKPYYINHGRGNPKMLWVEISAMHMGSCQLTKKVDNLSRTE
jgi:hypothetical protein